ncbi:Tab2/Atab2 family RNA-binding protein [Leptolyngbya cf. ectocarpi LEGE 11479]|uniref:Tab2/Atab2 family RNA-binding protein n=1 Tax=Leptolyngbya cf. ectocarpi LEGE 11479 TaxID=1828722 RepID=A0A928ZRU8_LEPEC|nr:Tab2/Atab2 family RNA-binding protein [Leptolyngbya ectocarpi]MBE9067078.1 Tab2/Atab2 family RNA-binding protein [Leptolyngbya cf. ectocarpi LEGE 11479]
MSSPWQLDFYRRPLKDPDSHALWELLLCTSDMDFSYAETCPQPAADAMWLRQQLKRAIHRAGYRPKALYVFRPQTQTLAEVACRELDIPVVAKRGLPTLKQWLRQRTAWYSNLKTYTGEPYSPFAIERAAPVPLPDNLWGETWRFAGLSNADLLRFQYEAIPVRSVPKDLLPLEIGLSSTVLIPGVVIDAGRRSMGLAQWMESTRPAFLKYMAGQPDGLILEAGLCDRFVFTTFDDNDVRGAANTFEQRKATAKGLHFLLIRPDDSGMTYSGLWLLQESPDMSVG